MNPDPWQWISDNVPWIFSGIGLVIVTAIIGGVWRTMRRKRPPANLSAASGPHSKVGVELSHVKARSADIGNVAAPDTGVVIDGGEFSEDLSIHEIAVGQRTGQQASTAPAPATQINNTTARDIHVGDKVYQAPPDPS